MNILLIAAAVLLSLVGAVHSIFGERWVFSRMRAHGLVPTNGGTVLREPHVRILWATWHLVTLLGLCLAAVLAWLALPRNAALLHSPIPFLIAGAVAASSLLVFIATRGKHLGWVGLLAVALLVAIGGPTG